MSTMSDNINEVLAKIIEVSERLSADSTLNTHGSSLSNIERNATKCYKEINSDKKIQGAMKLKNYCECLMKLNGVSPQQSVPWGGKSVFCTEVHINGGRETLIFLIADLNDILSKLQMESEG